MALTNAQKQAKHRLAVKERIAKLEGALADIAVAAEMFGPSWAATRAREALNPTTNPKLPKHAQ